MLLLLLWPHPPRARLIGCCGLCRITQQGESATSVRADSPGKQGQGNAVTTLPEVCEGFVSRLGDLQSAKPAEHRRGCLLTVLTYCCDPHTPLSGPDNLTLTGNCTAAVLHAHFPAALSRSCRRCAESSRQATTKSQSSASCPWCRHCGTVQAASRRVHMMLC